MPHLYQDLINDATKMPEDIFFELANAKTVSYRTKRNKIVSVTQNSTIDNSTGGIVWETSYLLATYIEKKISLDSHPNVLEVGAGCGLLGIAMALDGARVVLTEAENTMATLERNVDANKKTLKKEGGDKSNRGKLKAKQLRWDHESDRTLLEEDAPFNIIVGTDVFFDKKLVAPLMDTMRALSDSKTEVYLCFQERCAAAHAEFLRISKEYFALVEDRSQDLSSTKGCEAAGDLECFLFYLSGAIPQKKNNETNKEKKSKKDKKEKKEQKKEKRTSALTNDVKDTAISSNESSTTTGNNTTVNNSSSSWFKLAFQKAASRAEPDVTFPVQQDASMLEEAGDDEDEDEVSGSYDFNGNVVASIAKSFIEKGATATVPAHSTKRTSNNENNEGETDKKRQKKKSS
jgi:predicted nicotinamide N-methyase